jgi:uncharacterized CHY-type Zn-finger protein
MNVDEETRCAHWPGERDIVAIKFKCCDNWFSCRQCHAELAGHTVIVWPKEEFTTPAILCGACGHQLTVREYFDCGSVCPQCRRQFNPSCSHHRHFYFES